MLKNYQLKNLSAATQNLCLFYDGDDFGRKVKTKTNAHGSFIVAFLQFSMKEGGLTKYLGPYCSIMTQVKSMAYTNL